MAIEKQKKSDATNAQNELKQAQNSPKYSELSLVYSTFGKNSAFMLSFNGGYFNFTISKY